TLPGDAGLANLHKAAHHARRALGDRRAVVLRQGFVELAPDADVSTDVERFERGDGYPGPLLPDDRYEEWAIATRDRLHARHIERLRREQRWEELLAADPADEQAHRELMRDALSRLGLQPSSETLELAGELADGPPVHVPLVIEGPTAGRDAELAIATR